MVSENTAYMYTITLYVLFLQIRSQLHSQYNVVIKVTKQGMQILLQAFNPKFSLKWLK